MADDLPRHRIEVVCPECGATQTEPALVVSTQCRACRANFQVREGKGVVRTRPITRLKPPRKDSDPEEPQPEVPKVQPFLRRGPVIQAPQSFLKRIFNPNKPSRQITCFNCGHSYSTVGEAQSSQCPKCSGYVSLLNHDITTPWNRRIQTGGNVVIQKSGAVSGVNIQCHDLTVLGELAGSVECSGTVVIRTSGKITGKVQCRTLRVEKGARVEFLNPVTAETAYIDGNVRGQIFCSGTITLEKRAQLHGLVRTTDLIFRPGAKHTGTLEVISAAPSTSTH
jgi:cytoskeletal protein CcmA (bactofilin family)/Zn finger protein HypA/HybF involved in hydrogenase expression